MKYLKRIHLVDKFLIVFMAIFLLHAAFILFVQDIQSVEANTIDIIVKTSAAAIFGYFISANFVRYDSLRPIRPDKKTDITAGEPKEAPDAPEDLSTVRNQLGFAVPGSHVQPGKGQVLTKGSKEKTKTDEAELAKSLQIIITGAIGIIALAILLIYRDFFTMTSASAGTVSQLRDFVSGCVGFLIGSTTRRE